MLFRSLFAAVHESAIGPSRQFTAPQQFGRFRSIADSWELTALLLPVVNDPEQTFADPGNSRVARDMRRVDMETEREGSHDLRNSWLG